MHAPPYELRTIHCSGSARELGRAQGEAVREEIRGFVAQRLDALAAYLSERRQGGEAGHVSSAGFLEIGRQCLARFESWDPAGHAEQLGIAEGAGVSAEELYSVSNMTDVRDVLLLSARADAEGCSAWLLPPSLTRSGRLLAGQTWDLNPPDLEYVIAIHRLPAEGPETWSVTCVGSLSLMGMNQHGVAVGTTNIKTYRSRVGVGYLSVLHRAIRARSHGEARALVEAAPRAAAHTYWLADAQGGLELECNSEHAILRPLERQPIARTNHCLSPTLKALEGEAPNSSTHARLARMERVLGQGGHDFDSIRALYGDRSDGVDSICRYPEDEQGTSTNACIVCEPETRRLWACRGPADRGEWQELKFERD